MDKYKYFRKKEEKKNVKERETRKEKRVNDRMLALDERRNLIMSSKKQVTPKKKKSRLELLKEWKFQKEQKENAMKKSKRPPFYVGKIQRTATGSPKIPSSNVSVVTAPPTVQKGVVTRSRAKVMQSTNKGTVQSKLRPLKELNKIEGNCEMRPVKCHPFALPKAVAALQRVTLTMPVSPKITKSSRKSIKPFQEIEVDCPEQKVLKLEKPKSIRVNLEKKFTMSAFNSSNHPNDAHVKMETLKEACAEVVSLLEPAPETVDLQKNVKSKVDYSPDTITRPIADFEHLTFSPFIQKERGSARKSRSSTRKSIHEKVDEEIRKEETEMHSRIKAFRLFLANETKRLLGLSETWSSYLYEGHNVPSDVEGDINAVVGKTKLLTSDKFKQFQELIDKCEAGDSLIKVEDLQGFHDWVSLEVEDLDKVFMSLDERKKNNWVTAVGEASAPEVKKPTRVVKKVPKKPAGTSNMRAHIMAARKQMQAMKEGIVPTSSVTTPVKMPSPRHDACIFTPNSKSNLRVQVLKRCNGLEVIAATSNARLSLSPTQPPLLPRSPSIPVENNSSPQKSILRRTPVVSSARKNVAICLDPVYLQPAEDTPDDSPDILRLAEDSPKHTPVRRSARLARKSRDFATALLI